MKYQHFWSLLCAVAVSNQEITTSNVNQPKRDLGTKTDYVSHILDLIKTVPALKKMVETSGLNFKELQLLFGEKHLLAELLSNMYKLSPIVGQVIDEAAKHNAEIRVLLALINGKSPNLFDVLQLASQKQENIFDAVDKVVSGNAYAQKILHNLKSPHPNMTVLWNMVTGRDLEIRNILDTDKYSVATPSLKKNRHLEELGFFVAQNWWPLLKTSRAMVTLPIDFVKVLNFMLSLDYSAFRFALDTNPVLNSKKYVVINNKSKYAVVDHGGVVSSGDDDDITKMLNDIRVTYPSMRDQFEGPEGNSKARDAVGHILQDTIDVFNRLLS